MKYSDPSSKSGILRKLTKRIITKHGKMHLSKLVSCLQAKVDFYVRTDFLVSAIIVDKELFDIYIKYKK